MKSIILNDGKEYFIVKDLEINNNIYTLFANVDNENELRFRKKEKRNDKEYYVGLSDKNELELVINKFAKVLLEENK